MYTKDRVEIKWKFKDEFGEGEKAWKDRIFGGEDGSGVVYLYLWKYITREMRCFYDSECKKVKDVGVFKDYETKKTGLQKDFGKKNFIYGLNTYGKSTLCDIFKDVSDDATDRIQKDLPYQMERIKILW